MELFQCLISSWFKVSCMLFFFSLWKYLGLLFYAWHSEMLWYALERVCFSHRALGTLWLLNVEIQIFHFWEVLYFLSSVFCVLFLGIRFIWMLGYLPWSFHFISFPSIFYLSAFLFYCQGSISTLSSKFPLNILFLLLFNSHSSFFFSESSFSFIASWWGDGEDCLAAPGINCLPVLLFSSSVSHSDVQRYVMPQGSKLCWVHDVIWIASCWQLSLQGPALLCVLKHFPQSIYFMVSNIPVTSLVDSYLIWCWALLLDWEAQETNGCACFISFSTLYLTFQKCMLNKMKRTQLTGRRRWKEKAEMHFDHKEMACAEHHRWEKASSI